MKIIKTAQYEKAMGNNKIPSEAEVFMFLERQYSMGSMDPVGTISSVVREFNVEPKIAQGFVIKWLNTRGSEEKTSGPIYYWVFKEYPEDDEAEIIAYVSEEDANLAMENFSYRHSSLFAGDIVHFIKELENNQYNKGISVGIDLSNANMTDETIEQLSNEIKRLGIELTIL